MDLELEAKQWIKEKYMYGITGGAYQIGACDTAIFPKEKALEYLTLGLTGEAGEIANKVKKFIRDGASKEEYLAKRIEIGYEIGDVMWYIAQACIALDITMDDVIETNIEKLESRYPGGFDAYLSNNRKDGDI